MAYAITYRKTPVQTGSTLIQSTTLLNEVNAFEVFSISDIKKILKIWTREFLKHFPQDNEFDNWSFYRRNDMNGAETAYRTILARKVTPITVTEKFIDSEGSERTRRRPAWEIEMRGWYFAIGTATAGTTSDLIGFKSITETAFTNPEAANEVALPTDSYQGLHELLGMLYKPVAGTVPLTTPLLTSIGLGNPNGV